MPLMSIPMSNGLFTSSKTIGLHFTLENARVMLVYTKSNNQSTKMLYIRSWQNHEDLFTSRPVIFSFRRVGDFFMIWRLNKDFKFDIVFSACFDYNKDVYSIYICVCVFHAQICRKFITNAPHTFTTLHPKVRVKFILRLSKVPD